MPVTRELLIRLGASAADVGRYLDALNEAMRTHGITSERRIAHFLAQLMHESGCLAHTEENLRYSADGLRRCFRRHFRDEAEVRAYARQPERIGSRVYAERLGNGPEGSGDGYRYRGRGLIQLTGKDNYRGFADWLGADVVANPHWVAERYAVQSAVYFWVRNGLAELADADDLAAITRRVNGGLNGYENRRALLERARQVLTEQGSAAPVMLPPDPPTGAPFVPPAAQLSRDRPEITRRRDGGRAHPLGESDRPAREGRSAAALARSVSAIVDYLDVSNPDHRRYRPHRGATYASVYATDVACLCGVYLPRVWWNEAALRQLGEGDAVAAEYGRSVRELDANALFEWLEAFGAVFGWVRVDGPDALQAAANAGEVCVIAARGAGAGRAGGIAVVVPETDGVRAARNSRAEVLRPVESRAGPRNVLRAAPARAWWRGGRYRSHAFWRHA
ncbi:MAG: hypothetical protein CALGDGBN_01041 [Pseudomonadales bacterium]|nr:hypothetical protein [Pseudomonadales bacterium]